MSNEAKYAGAAGSWRPRWRFQAGSRSDVRLLVLKRKRREICQFTCIVAVLMAFFGWLLAGVWRDYGLIGIVNALPRVGLLLVPVFLSLRILFAGPDRILMDAEGLTVILRRRRRHALWHEIADITVHDTAEGDRARVTVPCVRIRLKTPSGVPLDWVDFPDIYEIDRAKLGMVLRTQLEAGLREPAPPKATRFDTALAAIRERDGRLIRFAAMAILAPLIYFAWLIFGLQSR